jgi:DNA gyrase/topoisomerase IV subunit A
MDLFVEKKRSLVIVTSSGRVKRMGAAAVRGSLSDGYWTKVIGLDKGDKVVFAAQAAEGDKLLLFTPRRGLCLRTSDISEQSTPSAKGVVGMNTKGDLVIGGGVVTGATGEYLVLVTTTGYIKKVSLKQISIHGRGAQGVALLNETPASGIVAAGAVGVLTKWVDVLTKRNRRQRIKATDVPAVRRRVNLGRKWVEIEAVEVLIR